MLLIPNNTNRIDAGVAPRGIPHPAFIYNPVYLDDVDDLESPFYIKLHRITGEFAIPPKAVLNAALCDEWQLDMAISFGSASISETALSLPVTSTIGKKAGADYTDTASYTNSDTSGDFYVDLSIDIGDLSRLAWGRVAGQWSLPLSISVSASDAGTMVSSTYHAGVSIPAPFGASYAGIVISICGETVLLYDVSGQDAAPTGTITLTPLSWLPTH